MGFDTSMLIQDRNEIGYFGIMTDCNIAIIFLVELRVSYSSSIFEMHLHLRIRENLPQVSVDISPKDLVWMLSSQTELHWHLETYNYVSSIIPELRV